MSQLLQQHQVLADRSAQYELQLASEREHQLAEVAELRAKHEQRVSKLVKIHNCEMARVNKERKVEPAVPRVNNEGKAEVIAQRVNTEQKAVLVAPCRWITNRGVCAAIVDDRLN